MGASPLHSARGHQMSLHRRGFGLGGNESYPGIFSRSEDSLTGYLSKTASQAAEIPGVGFEAKNELFRS